MRYDLKSPVQNEGMTLKSVMLRTPTRDDQQAVMRAAGDLARVKGRKLTDKDGFVLMIAQLGDLPREAVLKLSLTEAQALAGHVNRLFAERGMS